MVLDSIIHHLTNAKANQSSSRSTQNRPQAYSSCLDSATDSNPGLILLTFGLGDLIDGLDTRPNHEKPAQQRGANSSTTGTTFSHRGQE